MQSDAALELIGTNMRLENEGAIRVVGGSSGSEFLVTNGASLLQRSSGSIYLDDSSAVFAVGTSAFILEESIVSGTGSIVGSGTVVVRERGHLNVASGLLFVSDLRSGSPRSVAIVAQKGGTVSVSGESSGCAEFSDLSLTGGTLSVAASACLNVTSLWNFSAGYLDLESSGSEVSVSRGATRARRWVGTNVLHRLRGIGAAERIPSPTCK